VVRQVFPSQIFQHLHERTTVNIIFMSARGYTDSSPIGVTPVALRQVDGSTGAANATHVVHIDKYDRHINDKSYY